MEIKELQNGQSMVESSQILMAAAVIVRMAFGQIASCNALCEQEILDSAACKKAEKSYKDFMSILGKCHKAYVDKAEYYRKSEKVS